MACINTPMPTRSQSAKKLRTAIMLSLGVADVMFVFVMVAKDFIAGPVSQPTPLAHWQKWGVRAVHANGTKGNRHQIYICLVRVLTLRFVNAAERVVRGSVPKLCA